tara:strand:- start:120 stop:581 length:462 start_codon:yes stop_codon:yes gene_type:complete
MKNKLSKLFFIGLVFLSSCATIETYESMPQQQNLLLTAPINGKIFEIFKYEDLPNVFGKKDIYGGKKETGLTSLRFLGINSKGNILLRLNDIEIYSNASVFTRYLDAQENALTPQSTTDLEFNFSVNKILDLEYIKVEFVEVTSTKVSYYLRK